MKSNNHLHLYMICALGLFALCCGEDNTSDSNDPCQSCTETQICQNGKCVDKSEQPKDPCQFCTIDQICQNGKCVDKPCSTQGYVRCDGTCIDPMTSNAFCGANESCEGFENCGDSKSCTQGRCECEANEHAYNDGCEADSIENCGEHGLNCETTIDGWADGKCINGACHVTACQPDLHLNNNACEPDDTDHCGYFGSCSEIVDGWASGDCIQGKCTVKSCVEGMHVYGNECEIDDIKNCGMHDRVCEKEEICTNGECACPDGYALCGGGSSAFCVNVQSSTSNCGSCGYVCEQGQICSLGHCIGATDCDGTVRDTSKDVDHCGACNNRCGEGLICSEGICQAGNGEMYCNGRVINSLKDSANCGKCGNICSAGSKCIKGQCSEGTGATYCNGYSVILLDDSANCGQCGNKCDVGKICKSGRCQTGTGATYCNGYARNISFEVSHCGQCFNRCSTDNSCKAGVCTKGFAVGDTILFGAINNVPLQWYILDNDTTNRRFMVLAMDVIAEGKFNAKSNGVTWENCTIRSWLNGYDKSKNLAGIDCTSDNFMKFFTSEERAKIPKVNVEYDDQHSSLSDSHHKGNTQDYVFLLSKDEVYKFFPWAQSYQMYKKIHYKGSWWTRDTIAFDNKSIVVSDYPSSNDEYGRDLYSYNITIAYVYKSLGVRPALWINY